MKSRICVITGSRADYGLIRLVMKGIEENQAFSLQIIATGMHLSGNFGNTYLEIESDGFKINRKIECLSDVDSPQAIAEAIGQVLSESIKSFGELKPDLILILGDRYEIFAACLAALLLKIPIAHIHGGEVTEGSYDEAFRHSITKMSNIHFVATEEYRRRVIQLGESPETVHLVGGLGVDVLKQLKLLSKEQVERTLGFRFSVKSLLITFHPETMSNESPGEQINELLKALSERSDSTLIFTLPNADTGGLEIGAQIMEFAKENPNAHVFASLGQLLYLSCMQFVDGVVGNSSSGILEAPTMKVGTVNIGTRQQGRTQANSVINTRARSEDINIAIEQLYSEEFRLMRENSNNPYGDGGATQKILEILRRYAVDGVKHKSFYDLR